MKTIAKAIAPAVLGIVAALVQWASTGVLDGPELATAAGGLVTGLIVYLVPNAPPAGKATPPGGLSEWAASEVGTTAVIPEHMSVASTSGPVSIKINYGDGGSVTWSGPK